jgi:heme-degrading monooxygenase HmoA
MYARVITVQYQPGKIDEGIQIYRESILPETRQLKGYKGAMAMVDRSTDKAISITLWQSEGDAQASGESSAYLQSWLAKLTSLFATAPGIEMYEVVVNE